jgi:hypothetical protein
LQVAHCPPGVLIGSGKDMRDAEPVEADVDGITQTSKGDPSV